MAIGLLGNGCLLSCCAAALFVDGADGGEPTQLLWGCTKNIVACATCTCPGAPRNICTWCWSWIKQPCLRRRSLSSG